MNKLIIVEDDLVPLSNLDPEILILAFEKNYYPGQRFQLGDAIGTVISTNAKKQTVSIQITYAIKLHPVDETIAATAFSV